MQFSSFLSHYETNLNEILDKHSHDQDLYNDIKQSI